MSKMRTIVAYGLERAVTEKEMCPDGPPFLTRSEVTDPFNGTRVHWICDHAHWHTDRGEAERCNRVPTFRDSYDLENELVGTWPPTPRPLTFRMPGWQVVPDRTTTEGAR